MGPNLWVFAEPGFVNLLILIAQVGMELLWGGILVLRTMAANCDATIMSSGQVGPALGARPSAIVIQL